MRTTGKFLRLTIVIICLGFVGLLAREGKFSSVWNNVQGLFSGKKEHKLTLVSSLRAAHACEIAECAKTHTITPCGGAKCNFT